MNIFLYIYLQVLHTKQNCYSEIIIALLKICSELSNHSTVFMKSDYIIVIQVYNFASTMVRLELNYGYETVFYKNGLMREQFVVNF